MARTIPALTSSPMMSQQPFLTEEEPKHYVIENQHLWLRTEVSRVLSPYLPPLADLNYQVMLCNNFRHDHRAWKVVLWIEPQPNTDHCSEPLYTELLQAVGRGKMSQEASSLLWTNEAEGPLPESEHLIVTTWKWMWRGLDPTHKFWSPIYMDRLKGRVTVTSDGYCKGPSPMVTYLRGTRNIPRRNKKQRRRLKRVWSQSPDKGWTCRYCHTTKLG